MNLLIVIGCVLVLASSIVGMIHSKKCNHKDWDWGGQRCRACGKTLIDLFRVTEAQRRYLKSKGFE